MSEKPTYEELENRIKQLEAEGIRYAQVETDLKRSLQFTESLLEAVPTPVFFKDAKGRYIGCNPAFSDFMGVTAQELFGKTVQELWPSEHARMYHQKDLELIENPDRQIYEFEVRDKDGITRPVIFSKTVFYDENGKVAGIVGGFVDITEHKHSRSLLEATLESTADGILVVDEKGKWTGFNRKFIDMWNVPAHIQQSGDDRQAVNHVLENLIDPEA